MRQVLFLFRREDICHTTCFRQNGPYVGLIAIYRTVGKLPSINRLGTPAGKTDQTNGCDGDSNGHCVIAGRYDTMVGARATMAESKESCGTGVARFLPCLRARTMPVDGLVTPKLTLFWSLDSAVKNHKEGGLYILIFPSRDFLQEYMSTRV